MQQCFMFIDTGNGTGWTPVNDSAKDVAALDSFTIDWGSDGIDEQPDPAVMSFTIRDRTGRLAGQALTLASMKVVVQFSNQPRWMDLTPAMGSWHDLRAADEGSFQALIFPDSQSNDYSGWKELAQNAYERNPKAGFFVNMGDLVDNGEDHTQWNAWFDAVSGIIDRIPCVPLMGNHETYNQNWKVRLPEAWLHEFAVPQNGSTEFERYYYAFDYGPVHFTVLNTQWDELNEFKNGLLAEQISWLRKDLAGTKKKWKIVLLHKDVLQYRIHNRPERKEGISDVGEVFMPIFDEFQVDVVFSAHLHTYRNRGHIQNFRASSQGPYYILTGVAGNVRYPGLWTDHALDRTVAPQPETDNYLTLDAAENSLLIRCFLPNGDKIDHVLLNK